MREIDHDVQTSPPPEVTLYFRNPRITFVGAWNFHMCKHATVQARVYAAPCGKWDHIGGFSGPAVAFDQLFGNAVRSLTNSLGGGRPGNHRLELL